MQAGIEGQLTISLKRADQSVLITSTRPLQALSTLLKGKTVEQVLQFIPMLFSICGTAQSAAALKACEQALNIEPNVELWQARLSLVELETQREHVLRILLDWCQFNSDSVSQEHLKYTVGVLGQARNAWFEKGKAFDLVGVNLRVYPSLGDDAAFEAPCHDRANTPVCPYGTLQRDWNVFLEAVIFGESLVQWRERSNLASLQHWIEQQGTLAARTLKYLQEQALARLGSNNFTLENEASVLSRQAQQPLMQEALAEYGNGIFTRYLARLVELAFGVPSTSYIEAARGRLVHTVQLDSANKVLDYQIIAPTEINFSSQGVVSAGLQALMHSMQSDDLLKYYADLWIKAVDPCVSYRCEISHA
ncbi:MAG: hypothetical protein WAQ53_01425 [Thiofilum sp.]|uniref:hypothetical protein n=1 Tax=Thiofilum sp. TaxID=2212733 RepID=UPI0025E46A84|nr:hypothetical protein [Thiofilum sp.]MBK8455457.1 hypothetical protein [Thiofilum sp.]